MTHTAKSALVFALAAMVCAAEDSPLNPVERLKRDLADGSIKLHDDGTKMGYLRSVLAALHIDAATQVMVFSKTSLQMDRISPSNPRALYFNDEVSVGYVPDGQFLEFATFDAERGNVFYAIDLDTPGPLKVEQHTSACTSCHGSAPRARMVVESVYPMANGAPFISLGTIEPLLVDHRTPFTERWGGWYVTGTHGAMKHRGNSLPPDEFKPLDLSGPGNITTLRGMLDVSNYPLPTSDLISLMVFEHQMHVTNAIAKLNRIVRREERVTGGVGPVVEEVVQALFWSGEAKLESPIRGASGFRENYEARGVNEGRADAQGRSFYQFDLTRRMMRYPFSPLIYTPIYDALPLEARKLVAARLLEVLNGEGGEAFQHLSPQDLAAIREILDATKPSLLKPEPAHRQ